MSTIDRHARRPTLPRMPRRHRRAQLLAAAGEVFAESGYHAAAMDEIAERAGVSKPVLYRHFASKRELYLALLDHHCQSLVDAVSGALAATEDNRERVTATVHAYFDFVAGNAQAFRLVFESDLLNDPEVRERMDRLEDGCGEAVGEIIALDTGMPRQHARLLGHGLVGMSLVGARYWMRRVDAGPGGGLPPALPRDVAGDLMANLAWRGISSFPRTGPEGGEAGPPDANQ